MKPEPIFIKIQRGRLITIPKRFSAIKPGDSLRFRIWRGSIIITPVKK